MFNFADPKSNSDEIEPREPLSRPVSPQRPETVPHRRTIVAYDWEPFVGDTNTSDPNEPIIPSKAAFDPHSYEHPIEDPVPGYDPPHRTLAHLAELKKKLEDA